MLIGGFQKESLIDYPGKMCSIVFTVGCNFRCPFCHNSELVLPEKIKELAKIKEDEILSYLKDKIKFIDAVEITGGEPTLQKDLIDFIKKLKSMGYLVKLDSNGTNPGIIKRLLEEKLIDYYAMDIKAPLTFDKYNKVIGGVLTEDMFNKIKETISLVMNSGIEYEFRTTAIKGFHTKEDLLQICKDLEGARRYVIQTYNPDNVLDPNAMKGSGPFKEEEVKDIINKCKDLNLVENISYR